MMVLCILLAMLSLFLSLKLIYQRKLVQKVKKQIDFLIDRDTQTEIMVEKTDGTIQDLSPSSAVPRRNPAIPPGRLEKYY